jgi:hypothetical protein
VWENPPVRRLNRILRRRPAAAPSRPGTPAPDLTPVFVVTYGRSGSTLLQGLLNALPRTVVRGENGFYVIELFRATRRATEFAQQHRRHGVRNTTSAFFGLGTVRRKPFVTGVRRIMVPMLLGREDRSEVERLGFKEVLWHEVTAEETEPFFDWFDDVFPGARYILHTRDREALLSSGFWRHEDAESVFEKVDRVVEIHDFLRRTRPDRVLDTTYERFIGDQETKDAQLRELATFVTGGCDDELLDRLRAVLETRHGPYGRPGAVPENSKQYG